MKKVWIAALVVACSMIAPFPAQGADAPVHAAATCSDYDNQRDAQNAADTRDADGDGIYCEALPCPCSRGGSSDGGGGSGGSDRPRRPRKRAQVFRGVITDVVDGDTIKVRVTGGKRYSSPKPSGPR